MKLTKEEINKLRRDNYKLLKEAGFSRNVANKVMRWRKNYVKLYIKTHGVKNVIYN